MTTELIVAATACAIGIGWLVRNPRKGLSTAPIAAAACALTAGVWLGARYHQTAILEADVTDRPAQVKQGDYVSSSQCQTCHPHEYASWQASWHRTMTQVVTPESVVADLDSAEVTAYGRRFEFYRVGDDVWVDMDDPDYRGDGSAPRIFRRIVASTGSHFQQEYWYTNNNRKLYFIPLTYLIEQQRFVPYWSVFLRPPLPERLKPMHYAGIVNAISWEANCINCHTTGPSPRVPDTPGPPVTKVAEFGIACEACHGGGANHVEINRNPIRRFHLHLSEANDATIANATKMPSPLGDQVCGQCHSVGFPREAIDKSVRGQQLSFQPGEPLSRTRKLVRMAAIDGDSLLQHTLRASPDYLETKFWTDGEVRVSGREYSGMIESPCFARGEGAMRISCFSCHEMHPNEEDTRPLDEWANHQLRPAMRETAAACIGCHADMSGAQATATHTHHEPGSSGSLCQNCHMAHTTFGLLKAMRTHKVDAPSLEASVATGRPHACNLCHLDRSLQWTADYLERWYGKPIEVDLTEPQRFVPAALHDALAGDAGQRALAAWAMGWPPAMAILSAESGWTAEVLLGLLADPYDAVRYVAFESLRRQASFGDLGLADYDYVASREKRRGMIRLLRDRLQVTAPSMRAADMVRSKRDPETFLIELSARRDDRVVSLDE